MIEIIFGPDDLTRIRFARSPLEELVHSVPVLAGTRRAVVHGPWLEFAAGRVRGLDLRVLLALARGPRVVPDFLAPPPQALTGDLRDELDAIAATPASAVRTALEELGTGERLPAVLRPLYEDPERELPGLVDTMAAYWRAAVEPVWPRLRALHDADIAHRAGQLTTGGLARVFEDLHPEARFEKDRLMVDKPLHSARRSADGSGLLLVPCVFAWPRLLVLHNEPYQPTLTYSPRGIGRLWTDEAAGRTAEPLGELMGRSRAALLAHLDLPVSTSQLAAYLDLTSAAVSQHLSVLRRCRLVTSRRSGRWVLHQRTALADELLGTPARSAAPGP
ncbi:ArsR/SmtB family transcription factor [Streptomyces tanashiensis]|uniref:ArsR/SmtB family transcription factor n=1 Tax=Streptomyces tanashiensis TaxID=67367 RepID=UPI003414B9DE